MDQASSDHFQTLRPSADALEVCLIGCPEVGLDLPSQLVELRRERLQTRFVAVPGVYCVQRGRLHDIRLPHPQISRTGARADVLPILALLRADCIMPAAVARGCSEQWHRP